MNREQIKEKIKEQDDKHLSIDHNRGKAVHDYTECGLYYLNDKLDGYFDALDISISNINERIDKLEKLIKKKEKKSGK
jgi:hypothetical protein